MTKLHRSLLGTILGASILAFSGCGGGDSSDSDVSTAYLVDSAVKGVNYRCGTQSGTTGTDGSFNYQHGQTCTFSIGATSFTVAADKLAAGKSITPYDIFAGDDEKVVNLARLLQTLDSDHNASINGIDINATAHAQITHQIDFGSDFNITAEVAGSVYANQIVTSADALKHLAENVAAPTSYTAFERIAEIDLSDVNGSGAANSNNPTTVAKYVARKIAKHFYMTNDTNVSSNADWVLGGAPYTSTGATTLDPDTNGSVLDPYILEIPSPDNNKTMIVEVCNKKHAGLAMSMGAENSPALPCEISIYMDATTNKIYVDILDPVGSFAIFFNKITTNQDMLTAMALQVKTEIKLIAYNALKETAITHVKKATPMGPTFTPAQIQALNNQYLTYTYDINTSSSAWIAADTNITKKYQVANLAASALITKMTVNNVNSGTYGINGTDLNTTLVGNADYNLSETGYWRSARSAALKVPRSTDAADDFIYTVEACSPTYAKIALSLGSNGDSRNHTAALPCQMSFYIDGANTGTPKLKIVFLNPAFMFQTLFSDMMSQTHVKGYTPESLNAMVTTVSNDLVNMTRYVMDHNVTSVIPYTDIKTN